MISHQDTFKMALHNLKLNKRRSGLAMIGIIMGVMGVMIMGIVGTSARKVIFEEIKTFGLQTVWISRNPQTYIPNLSLHGSGIDYQDINAIKQHTKWISEISGIIERQGLVTSGQNAMLAQLLYVEKSYAVIENDSLISGRLWVQSDIDFAKDVCVISQDIAENLFNHTSAIGQRISIADSSYEIIGVIAKKDRDILKSIGIGAQSTTGRVLIPLSVALTQRDSQEIDYIQLSAKTTLVSHLAAQEAIQVLNRRHRGEFIYRSVAMKNYIDSFEKISNVISIVLGIAISIALVVGGIGIANVMTIAVVERTQEIGIRLAVGATTKDIFNLFLIEATILTSVAGIIGVSIGSMLGLIGFVILPHSFVFPFKFVGLGFVISVLTGVISGVYPAISATKKSPAEALRYE